MTRYARAVAAPFRSPLASDANDGRVALVTGGGTGVGRAVARELARTGAHLAVCGRRPEPLESVRAELEQAGAECLAIPADIREPEQASLLVERTLERYGRVDILVNNAGGQFLAPAEEISLKGWRAVHRLAVDAAWDLTRTVAERSMISQRSGVVVFVGFSPRRGIPQMAHAAAARAALENLTGSLAAEWSRYGIRAVRRPRQHPHRGPRRLRRRPRRRMGARRAARAAGDAGGSRRRDRLPRLSGRRLRHRDDGGRRRRGGRVGPRRAAPFSVKASTASSASGVCASVA